MAVRMLVGLSSPLMQCLKYSATGNFVAVRPSKFTSSGFLINVRGCQSSSQKSEASDNKFATKDQSAKNNITLVFPDGASILTSLARAKRIAEKRSCELVDVCDDHDSRVVYRLVQLESSKNCKAHEDAKHKSTKKSKTIEMSTTTTVRDLLVKCKKIVKMLQNNNVVCVSLFYAEKQHKESNTSEKEIMEILGKEIEEFGTISGKVQSPRKLIYTIKPRSKDVPESEGSEAIPEN